MYKIYKNTNSKKIIHKEKTRNLKKNPIVKNMRQIFQK